MVSCVFIIAFSFYDVSLSPVTLQLLRGYDPLPGATAALKLLNALEVPHLFLTNGGGVIESEKVEQLSSALGVDVEERQVVLAHTPLQDAAAQYKDKRVLVLGGSKTMEVAHHYGFKYANSVHDIVCHSPSTYPLRPWPKPQGPLPAADQDFAAVIIMYDPVDWAPDLQVALDVIRGGSPHGTGPAQCVPVFASNPDFVFAGRHAAPRLAQGAFTDTLKQLFFKSTGQELQVHQVGKPTAATYKFASDALQQLPGAVNSSLSNIYMIGDNPHADIRGANLAGDPWRSILLCSGVHSPPPLPSPLPGSMHQWQWEDSMALQHAQELLQAPIELLSDEFNDSEDPAWAVSRGVLNAVLHGLKHTALEQSCD